MAVGSALLAVAPKCPICFLAYFGVFGVATTSAAAYRVWLPPATAMWLALTVGMLAIQKNGPRRYGPVALAIVAAVSIYGGKFIFSDEALVYGGMTALIAAVVWRSWSRRSALSSQCAPCEQLSPDQDRRTSRPAELPNYGGH